MSEKYFKSYETYKPMDKRRKTTDNLEFYTQEKYLSKRKVKYQIQTQSLKN